MNKTKCLIFLIFLLTFSNNVLAQVWGEVYTLSGEQGGQYAIESYDGGFLFLGYDRIPGDKMRGILIKTDVNGNLLWKKYIGGANNITVPIKLAKTHDGGVFITGYTDAYDSKCDPFILKLNSCGEKETAYIIRTREYNFASRAFELGDNTILANCYRILRHHEESTTLLKFKPDGKIVWQKTSFIKNNDLQFTSDSVVLLTGTTYTPFGEDSSVTWVRTAITEIDTSGKLILQKIYRAEENFLSGGADSRLLKDNSILTLAYDRTLRKDGYPIPFLIRYKENGDTLWAKFLSDTKKFESPGNIEAIDDTLSIISTWMEYTKSSYQFDIKLYKIDQYGNVLDTNVFSSGSSITPISMEKTKDGKFIIGGSWSLNGQYEMHLLKVNSNLQADTFYPGVYKYDSLCPYSITNSTITFDSAILIPLELDSLLSVENPEIESGSPPKLSPNPCTTECLLELPDEVAGKTELLLFSIDGRLVRKEKFNGNSLKLNVKSLPNGFYLYQLRNEKYSYSGKLIVE